MYRRILLLVLLGVILSLVLCPQADAATQWMSGAAIAPKLPWRAWVRFI